MGEPGAGAWRRTDHPYLLKRVSVETEVAEDVAPSLLGSFAADHRVSFDADNLTGVGYPLVDEFDATPGDGTVGARIAAFLPVTYRWTVEPTPDGSVIHEELRSCRVWGWAAAGLLASFGILLLAMYVAAVGDGPAIPGLEGQFLPMILFVAVGGLLLASTAAVLAPWDEGLLSEAFLARRPHTVHAPHRLPGLSVWGLFYLGTIGFLVGVPQLLGFAGILSLAEAVVVLTAYESLDRWFRRLDPPSPAAEYAQLLFTLFSPLLVMGLVRFLVQDYGAVGPMVVLGAEAIGLLLGLPFLENVRTGMQRPDVYQAVYRSFRESTAERPRVRLGLLVFLVAVAYSLVAVSAVQWVRFAGLRALAPILAGVPPINLVVLAGLAAEETVVVGLDLLATAVRYAVLAPPALLGVGLGLQLATATADLARLLRRSRQGPRPDWLSPAVRVRIVETSGRFASSLHVPPVGLIFVSETMVAALDEDEFAALLAHEAGHIHHGDAWLTLAIPYLATALLLGRNVLYGLLDFPRRELRADAFAVDRVGTAAVASLLETLRDPDTTIAFNALGGGLLREVGPAWFRHYHWLFFDTFALAAAHPSIDERLRAIDAR